MDANDKKLIQLLERWQSGNFTRADEQELQRLLAESDGFGREAADGILSFPEENHLKRLASIRKRLPQKDDRTTFFSGRMFALAASFALLLVAVWWMFSPGKSDEKVAKTAPEMQQSAPGAANNSTSVSSDAALPDVGRTAPLGSAGKSMANGKGNTAGAADDSAEPRKSAPGAPIVDVPKARERAAAVQAPVAIAEERKDAESLEDISLSDSNAGYANTKPEIREDIPRTIENAVNRPVADEKKTESFEQNQVNMQRGASTPVNTYPNAPATASNTGKVSTKKSKTITAPAPAGGWTNFRNEMSRQLTLPQTARDKGLSTGKVTMILDIGPLDGKIRSVNYTNRFGYGCDELAEQFVQKFNWVVMPGGPTEIEVDILFK